MDIKSVWFCVLVVSLQLGRGRLASTPCPGIYGFYKDKNDPEDVFGKITLEPDIDDLPVSSLEVRINFTVVGPRPDNYNGHIEPRGSVRRYNQGEVISYRVYFPVNSPNPKVTAVTVNGDIICSGPGDVSRPGKRVSRISLRYTQRSGSHTPEISRPVYEPVVTRPPRPKVTTSQDRFSNTSITTDECGVVAASFEKVPLINNGKLYERGEIPWLVAIYRTIQNDLKFICGGTLLSDRHVISAAHCMSRPGVLTPIIEIVIKIGVHRLNDWSDDITVTRELMAATIHKEYNPDTLENDILIMTLNKRVTFNQYIRPACLWSGDTDVSRVVGATGVVAGWGDRGNGGIGKQDEPQMVYVPIVTTTKCRASKVDFHKLTNDKTLCAGDRNGVGPCNGDSGGGLYLLDGGKWRLRGIVSVSLYNENGARICNLNEYIVYTDAAQFLSWIRNILSEKYFD